MKKRLLAIIITLCMLGTQLSAVGFADEVTETTEVDPITVMVQTTEQASQESPCTCDTLCSENKINTDCAVCSAKGANLEEVCAGDEAMAFVPGLTSLSSSENADALSVSPSFLNDLEKSIYSKLSSRIEEIAVTGGEMIVSLGINGLSFDNGGETDNDKLLDLALDYYHEKVSYANVFSCLISEYPYEMFWFNKMDSSLGAFGINIYNSGNTTYIDSVTYYMPVYDAYQDKSASQPRYTLSVEAASKAAQAAAYAKEIVDANAGKSDVEKLKAYKDAICDLTSYDLEAVEIIGNPEHPLYDTFYGDPFQITSVFDRDPSTKTVTEGYTRAFQYLCDLSDFDSTQCYYIAGEMSATGTSDFIPGGEQHWLNFNWNIVKVDGKSYLVDVTNCDEGTFGAPDYMFMKEPIRGNVNDGYWFSGANGSEIHYIYDDQQYVSGGLLDTTILDLNGRYMTGSLTLSGTAKIGETLTAEIKGVPTNSTIQWYRDDTPVPGANGNTYTLSSGEDVGKTIKVVVSASGCEGTLTAQTSEKVVKASPEPVNDINILSITDTSITIETHPGEVYACVDESSGNITLPSEDQWGTSGEFTGLSAGKVYAIFARRNETDTHYGTPTSGYKFEIITTSYNILMYAEITVDPPVKYQDLPTSATVNTANMTATLVWYEGKDTSGQPVTGKAKPNQYYTALVTLKADDGYTFGKDCTVVVNNTSSKFPYENVSSFSMNITFTQPTAPVELTNIEITKQPNKTSYISGENFDPTGMAVTAYYDDGTNKAVDLSECTFTPETLTAGVESVTVNYGGKSASIPVTVTVPRVLTGIEITKQPNKTEYKENENFDPTGMEITAKYSDGSTAPVSAAECTFSPEIMTEGVTLVTVSYMGKTASVAVTVVVQELTDIEVTKQPDKTEYFDGESFDPTGMEITAKYSDGSSKQVSIDNCTFSPETLTTGVTSVTVTYNGKTAAVSVTVKAIELTGIEITKQPDKTEYFDGESFDQTGMEITASYNNGAKEPVSIENCTFSPETLTTGVTSVTVSYNGKTAVVSVTVKEVELTGIEITKQPDKTEYFDGDSFDPAGMEITAVYNNGSREPVSVSDCTFSPEKLTTGVTSVTVSYNGKTANVSVTVKAIELTGIEITKQPDKTVYDIGDKFDPTGIEITAIYNNGSKELVSIEKCTFSPETITKGVNSVTVSYGGKTASVTVTALIPELASIKITKQPYKLVYNEGESFDPTGMEIEAVYENGAKEPVQAENCAFTPNVLSKGDTEVTVNYGGKTALVYINVNSENITPKFVMVGNTDIMSGGYWTSADGITWTKYDGIPEDNYVYYDPDYKTLTLHNATIHGERYGIYALGLPHESVEITIKLEGENIISNTGGINVSTDSYQSSLGKDATLTIHGPGSLKVDSWQNGITVEGNSGKTTLNINNASVESSGKEILGRGIILYSGVYAEQSEIIININESSVTARCDIGSSRAGICYSVSSNVSENNIAELNISDNSVVNVIGGISKNNLDQIIIETDDSSALNGILIDSVDNIVYGNVELHSDFTLENGQSLTLAENSTLTTGSYAVIVKNGGILNGTVDGTVKYAPNITTESLTGGNVGTSYEQQLIATGYPTITWSITEGSLPEGLNLDKDTGVISGTPAAKGTYSFTVTATNSIDSYSREFSLDIAQYELGDVNMDGVVNISDATTIQRYIVSMSIEGTFNKTLADVNQDGVISISDVSLIQIILTKK